MARIPQDTHPTLYSANSGFYFVRHNDRTQFFLAFVLMAGDLVIKTDSHQQALVALLSEHASLYGLRAKVVSRDIEEFPGTQIESAIYLYYTSIFG